MLFLFLPVLEELDAFWLQNGSFSLINAGKDFHRQNIFFIIFFPAYNAFFPNK
jgi:hypothetical protein